MLNGAGNNFGISILHQSMKHYTKFPCHNLVSKQWYAVKNEGKIEFKACFIYFDTEISVVGRTENSIMECTDRSLKLV